MLLEVCHLRGERDIIPSLFFQFVCVKCVFPQTCIHLVLLKISGFISLGFYLVADNPWNEGGAAGCGGDRAVRTAWMCRGGGWHRGQPGCWPGTAVLEWYWHIISSVPIQVFNLLPLKHMTRRYQSHVVVCYHWYFNLLIAILTFAFCFSSNHLYNPVNSLGAQAWPVRRKP